ncbi:hypothetical protein DL96DRAFT_1721793 [Flagelloscypha sp. PMI_526]|nr:hypothetical protein DL96DRAFT_1721793 [Flagelloscypha sp. PMI_526]
MSPRGSGIFITTIFIEMTDLGDSEPQIRLSPVKISELVIPEILLQKSQDVPELSSPFETKHDHDNLILRCIDHIDLHTNHILLAYASPVFMTMTSLNPEKEDEGDVVTLTETSFAWDRLLRWIDPRHDPILLPTMDVQLVIDLANRYDMNPLKLRIAARLEPMLYIAPKESLAVWALAIGLKNRSLVVDAARSCNGIDLLESDDVDELDFVPATAFRALSRYIVTVRDSLSLVYDTEDLLRDAYKPTYKACKAPKCSGAHDVYQAWLATVKPRIKEVIKQYPGRHSIKLIFDGICLAQNTDISSCSLCRPDLLEKLPPLFLELSKRLDTNVKKFLRSGRTKAQKASWAQDKD